MVRRDRRTPGRQVVDVVPAEPQPREEDDEANHQQDGAPAIGFLLLKEVERAVVRHAFGFIVRSTWGTAFSAWSSISHRSAGWALAIPATRLVGNCCCLVLYCVAVSLYSWRANAALLSADVSSSWSCPMFPVALSCGYW